MKIKVAVIQETPILFNLKKTTDKVISIIQETTKKHAPNLILFPESFIPAYPRNMLFGTMIGSRSAAGRDLWEFYFDNSFDIHGSEAEKIAKTCKENKVYVSLGVTEKLGKSLYCSQLFYSPEGKLVGVHRKIKPTGTERLVWGEGDGSGLEVYQTDIGKTGGLICWENYMPLARMALYQLGIEIYLAPTADNRPSWQHTLKHIAQEGRCFVLGCNQFVSTSDYPDFVRNLEPELKDDKVISSGGSTILNPFGETIIEPVYNKTENLIAELNMDEITRAKMDFDVAGHYHRPDIFTFEVKKQPKLINC